MAHDKPLIAGKRVHKTFMFTDVVKSTDIRAAYLRKFDKEIGNKQYDDSVLLPHDKILDRLVAEFSGEVISTAGDSYFVVFDSAKSAVECAVALQREFIKEKILPLVAVPGLPSFLQIRIGLHTGGASELVRAGKPNYSDHTINIAARIEGLAHGEQVLMSEETWNNAGWPRDTTKRKWKGYKLQGVDGDWTLVEALWDGRLGRAPQTSVPIGRAARLAQLPPVVQDFTGRVEELTELLAKVRTGGVVISGLQGMAGIGKTSLAVKLAHELKPDYPDAQIFLDLKGVDSTEHSGVRQNPLSSAEVMWHVVRSFDPNLKRPDSDAEVESAYRTLLNGRPGQQPKRAILLFDNARDNKQVKPLLPPPSCLLLVTSRQRFDLPGMYRKDLDRMQPHEAEELLLVIAPRIGSHSGKIAELCGRLPLALELAARALNKEDSLSPEEVIERLEKPRSPLRWKELREVETSFNLSYELLSEDLQKLWRALAVFPESFDTAAAAAIWDLDTIGAKDHLVELRGYSLLELDKGKNRYRLHDLARNFADSQLNDNERNSAQRRHARHYQQVLSRAEDLYLSGGDEVKRGLQLFDLEWSNISTGQAWGANHAELDDEAAQLCISYARTAFYTLHLRLHPRKERIPWLKVGLNVARSLKDSHSESTVLGNLGVAWFDLGKARKAIKYHELGLAIARKIGDRQGEGRHLGNLGNPWKNLGEARKAIEYYEQALDIAREIGDRRGEDRHLGNLGNAWKELGETRKAIQYYEQALDIARRIGEHRNEGLWLGHLGNAWKDLGKVREAIEYYGQALDIARKIGDHLGEGSWLGNLGVAWSDIGEARKAIEYYEQALDIAREIGDRRGEDRHLGNLGNAWKELGETRKAIEYHEQALTIARELSDRRGEGSHLGNLGVVWSDLGKARKAIEYYEQALDIAREVGDRRNEGIWLGNLGNGWYQLGKAHKAIENCEQSLVIARKLGDKEGEGHQFFNLGLAWETLGKKEKAIELMESSLKRFEETESPMSAQAHLNIERLQRKVD